MGDKSKIQWTDATWNPVTGCTKVSPGCDNCYAERITNRFGGPGAFDVIKLHEDRLDQPLRWTRPRMVFVNSMSDLFHPSISLEFIAKCFAVMAQAKQHTFQILTKRPRRMSLFFRGHLLRDEVCKQMPNNELVNFPLPNVWLGVSCEDQKRLDARVPLLLDTPAAIRFVSLEPLLGPIDLKPRPAVDICIVCGGGPSDPHVGHRYRNRGLDWVIVGGESGAGARPMHPDWPKQIRDDCLIAGVPFFFKQWGQWGPEAAIGQDGAYTELGSGRAISADGTVWNPHDLSGPDIDRVDPKYHVNLTMMYPVGKNVSGRHLDGDLWDELPALGLDPDRLPI